MNAGIVWCPHCGQPHRLSDTVCPTTGLLLDQRVHVRAHGRTSSSDRHSAVPGVPAQHPLIGTLLDGKYEILSLLGKGGIGEVFEARNRILGKRVAIKIVSNATPTATARLRREATIIASLQHPNICDLYDVGSLVDGSPYLVLELLKGETLDALIRRRRLHPKVAVEIFSHILSGLQVAHAAGIIHRDLKPANIFLFERVGCAPVIKILDFGFAKDVSGRSPTMTKPGKTCGTPAYMSPEQLLATPIDHRSDLFSVGLMLFEALTGQHPFAAPSLTGVCINIVRSPPVGPQGAWVGVPDDLHRLVHRALDKNAAMRFVSALEMQSALIESVDDGDTDVSERSSGALPRLSPDSSTDLSAYRTPHK
jgi:eukaryotic-like serine/threonine-protein kinase